MPSDRASSKPLTYADSLRIEELQRLQQPPSEGPEHDEFLFIVIHQVYELWFRQILHDVQHLRQALEVPATAAALATFKRILTLLKTLVSQVDILETMIPLAFASLRSRLASASGLQSAQFREVEFVLGCKNRSMAQHHPPVSPGRQRLRELLDERTIGGKTGTGGSTGTAYLQATLFRPLFPDLWVLRDRL